MAGKGRDINFLPRQRRHAECLLLNGWKYTPAFCFSINLLMLGMRPSGCVVFFDRGKPIWACFFSFTSITVLSIIYLMKLEIVK